ncbi:site-specific recombinase XerD [Humibacillus xanthopallidus]|uniref:Site-specific recombinase XerD n=1 Tax=Humibacillus xanthopallidus TaxID=412689 RepID=A0A543PUF4_9MICO|nr:tyrosine-type recombinase/integrase [Humibacillus xanthopallidus]TQN47703.1 site-specific recombinase XerD [Humibacillus xanthopallidus]
MTDDLTVLIGEYLAFRTARGFQQNPKVERLLTQFVTSLSGDAADRADGRLFTNGQALAWAHAPAGGSPAWLSYRLSAVRQFAVFLAGSGLPVEVPAVRQGVGGSRRATPYLYTNADVRALMAAADDLFTPLKAATLKTLTGLLAVTGMRIGEALQLIIGDLDLDHGVIVITQAKYGRQRIVLLEATSRQAVAGYLSLPVRGRLGTTTERPVFVTSKGTALAYGTAQGAFHQMTQRAGLPPRARGPATPARPAPCVCDPSMIDAYRHGRDPARTLSLLSVWLGHANPADTYWYLQAAPEVAALAALRLEPGLDGRELEGEES